MLARIGCDFQYFFSGRYTAPVSKKQHKQHLRNMDRNPNPNANPNKRRKVAHEAHVMARQRDADAWEENRMLTSGVAQRKTHDNTLDEEEEATRVHLLVHDIKPPFLDGRKVFTKQIDPVSAVRDPQSDLAVFSRKGSRVVKEKRQQRERQKQAQEATSIAGSALGNLMGVKEDDGDTAAPVAAEEEYKGTYKFAEHMKKDEGQSDFSKSKTLREVS